MKTKVNVLCVFLMYCACTQAQTWIPQGIGSLSFGYSITSISVPNDSVIWLTASSTSVMFGSGPVPLQHVIKVRRSIDAGKTWESYDVEEATGRISFEIEAIDASTAWLTTNTYNNGLERKLFKTSDGGESWSPKLTHHASGAFVEVLDDMHIYCQGAKSKAWTADGGESWEVDTIQGWEEDDYFVLASGNNLACSIGDTIWVGTSNGNLIRTTNFGGTTEVIQGVTEDLIQNISFIDHLRGMMFYYNGSSQGFGLKRTYDGGTTWEETPSKPSSGREYNIAYVPGTLHSFIAVTNVYGNASTFYWTTDFGETWTPGGFISGATTNAVQFSSPSAGWVTMSSITGANKPIVYKWNSDVLSSTTDLSKNGLLSISVSPNPTRDFASVSVTAETYKDYVLLLNDSQGKLCYKEEINDLSSWSRSLDLRHLPGGSYTITIATDEGAFANKLILLR